MSDGEIHTTNEDRHLAFVFVDATELGEEEEEEYKTTNENYKGKVNSDVHVENQNQRKVDPLTFDAATMKKLRRVEYNRMYRERQQIWKPPKPAAKSRAEISKACRERQKMKKIDEPKVTTSNSQLIIPTENTLEGPFTLNFVKDIVIPKTRAEISKAYRERQKLNKPPGLASKTAMTRAEISKAYRERQKLNKQPGLASKTAMTRAEISKAYRERQKLKKLAGLEAKTSKTAK